MTNEIDADAIFKTISASLPCDQTVRKQISAYHRRGFHREALLIALCAGGMRVDAAICLTMHELSDDSWTGANEKLRQARTKVDQLLENEKFDLDTLRWEYLRSCGAAGILRKETGQGAFASQKTSRFPTRRTAERWISLASRECHLRSHTTLVAARILCRKIKSRKLIPSRIIPLADSVDWLLRRSFPREDDFADAKEI